MRATRSDLIDRPSGPVAGRLLYVAWQAPDRSIVPVGQLAIHADGTYEFRYLAAATTAMARPFTAFPRFDVIYRAAHLFPFFDNRMVPVGGDAYADLAARVGMGSDADPFELLAATGGPRATDTIEVFCPPAVEAGAAAGRFLVRGVRHRSEAEQAAVDRLRPGDLLVVRTEPDNPQDPLALLLEPGDGLAVGWVPAYLCPPLHRAAAAGDGWHDVMVTVRHVGPRQGPSHFRLLCDLAFPWPFAEPPLALPPADATEVIAPHAAA